MQSYTEIQDDILTYNPLYMNKNGQWHPIEIIEKNANNQFILVKIKGFETRDEAAKLTNILIGIKAQQLPVLTDDEYYWHELIGYKVTNLDNEFLGEVSDLIATGSNDVLIVSGEKKHLIPYIRGQFIISIDRNTKEIKADWDKNF